MAWIYVIFYLMSATCGIHDIHVSLCDINISDKHQRTEIILKIFLDDLEAAIQYSEPLKILTPKEHHDADSLVAQYIQRQFKISGLSYTYLGKEASEDFQAGYFYLEANYPPTNDFELTNKILTEWYGDQRNIIKILHNDKQIMTTMLFGKKIQATVNW